MVYIYIYHYYYDYYCLLLLIIYYYYYCILLYEKKHLCSSNPQKYARCRFQLRPHPGTPHCDHQRPSSGSNNHGLSCCHGPKLGIQPAKMCIRSAEMDRNGGSTGKNVQIQPAKNWIRGVKNGDNGI